MATQNEDLAQGLKLLAEMQNAQAAQEAREQGNPNLDSAAQDTKEEELPKKPEFITCPCCGKPTLVKPLELSGPVLDHYMSCLISGVPFSHTYPVYKGKLEITVTRLSKEQEQTVKAVNAVLENCEKLLSDNLNTVRELAQIIKLYVSIKDIRVMSASKVCYPQDIVLDVCSKILELRIDILADTIDHADLLAKVNSFLKILMNPEVMSAVPSSMLAAVVETHSHLFYILMDSGFDVNFWKGIELA